MSLIDVGPQAALVALFVSAFVSATLLPGGSELVLVGLVHQFPEQIWPAIMTATIGNVLGSLTSYGIGRVLPQRVQHRSIDRVRRYGAAALLFAWLPVVGDALCVAAGWLRLPLVPTVLALSVGKFARYLAIAQGVVWMSATG